MNDYSDIITRLKGAKNQHLSDWEQRFVESVSAQHDRGRKLSEKQVEWLKKFDDKYSEERITTSEAWQKNFMSNKNMQDTFRVCVDYYYSTGYYNNIVTAFRNVDLSLAAPTPLQYNKLTTNKYAQKILIAYCSEPKYDIGVYVALRASRRNVVQGGKSVRLRAYSDDPVRNCFMVLSNNGSPTSAAKGSKKYKIIHMGENIVLEIEERDIKKYRG